MIEYLIRQADGDVPVIAGDLGAVFTPAELGAQRVSGWGDHRVRIDATEIAFAMEPPGWQVSFEGPMSPEEAERFVSTVADRMAEAVGTTMTYVCVSSS